MTKYLQIYVIERKSSMFHYIFQKQFFYRRGKVRQLLQIQKPRGEVLNISNEINHICITWVALYNFSKSKGIFWMAVFSSIYIFFYHANCFNLQLIRLNRLTNSQFMFICSRHSSLLPSWPCSMKKDWYLSHSSISLHRNTSILFLEQMTKAFPIDNVCHII